MKLSPKQSLIAPFYVVEHDENGDVRNITEHNSLSEAEVFCHDMELPDVQLLVAEKELKTLEDLSEYMLNLVKKKKEALRNSH